MRPTLILPGEVSIMVSGVYLPLSKAATSVRVFMVEPGSYSSVMARLRMVAAFMPRRLFGLYTG